MELKWVEKKINVLNRLFLILFKRKSGKNQNIKDPSIKFYLISVSIRKCLVTSLAFERLIGCMQLLHVNTKVRLTSTCRRTQLTLEHWLISNWKERNLGQERGSTRRRLENSPLWINLCAFREFDWVNLAWQMSHSYGFSPVWILKNYEKCKTSWNFAVKNVSHLKCRLSLNVSGDAYVQCGHWYGLSPVWHRMWRFSFDNSTLA